MSIAASPPENADKSRILFLISSFSQGGAERHLLELIKGLDPARYDCAICVLRNQLHYTGELPANEPRFPIGRASWFDPRTVFAIRRAIREFRPHVLHCYLNDGNLWGRLAARISPDAVRPKIITSVHLDDMEWTYRRLEAPLARFSDVVVAHSNSISRFLVDRLSVPATKVRTFQNGVDADRFLPLSAEARHETRAAIGVPASGHCALMAARIAPQKNHRLVMQALGRLRAEGALPHDFRLVLAGRVSSKAYDRGMRADILRLGLGDQVVILGARKDMPSLYASMDSVWLPSRTEASPIAALEGSACARPVLISDAANTDQVVLDGRTGWEVPANDLAALAARIRGIVALGAAELDGLGQAGRAHVREHFGNAAVSNRFAALYDELRAGVATNP